MKIERKVLKFVWLAALAGLFTTAGCEVEQYDFENPFDGSGDLYSFGAVSKPGFVELSWSSMNGVDFDGYAIFRGPSEDDAASGKEAHLLVKKGQTYVLDDDFANDGEKLYYSVAVYRGSVTSGSPQRSKVIGVTVVVDSDGDGIGDSKDANPNRWDCKKEPDCPSGMSCSVGIKSGIIPTAH